MSKENITIYSQGLISLSVCAPKTATKEEIEEAANQIYFKDREEVLNGCCKTS